MLDTNSEKLIVKIWRNQDRCDFFLFNFTECTQKYVEDNYNLIAETDSDLPDWFKNFSINRQLYHTHAITKYKDNNYRVKNIFASPYWVKSLKEIKENPQIENINNAICPVCDYVDYDCWENSCPDENYKCPQCGSNSLLEHRFVEEYGGYGTFYQRTTFKKLHKCRGIKVKG